MHEKPSFSYWLQYLIVRFLALLATALPVEVSHQIACGFGTLSYWILGKRRRIALENIANALGNSLPERRKKEIARSAFQNAALSMMELFTVEKIKKEAEARFKLSGNEFLEEAFSNKRGVVLVISHLGSWEYLSFLPYFTKRSWSVVVKNIKNPYLDTAIDAMRRVMTVNPISKDSSVRAVLQELKAGHGVAILVDQWAGNEGLWIDFFGIETSTTSIPARLAEKTGCALVPAYCLRKSPGHYEIHIEKPILHDMDQPGWENTVTKDLNQVLERQILAHPEQWLWGHRRWKNAPAHLRTA
ncbi:MAG: lysophospholipid acyltransferase family protein [Candidatus Omnitrophica bacterium]|nr:lysophospholipid acyltransferase family protein [Candidatus Omnitrophota bacterium]